MKYYKKNRKECRSQAAHKYYVKNSERIKVQSNENYHKNHKNRRVYKKRKEVRFYTPYLYFF